MLTWDIVRDKFATLKPLVDKNIALSSKDIGKYPTHNGDGEYLSQLLANLNWYVQKLGDLQSDTEQLKLWTEKRYDIEKGMAAVRIAESGKAVTHANNAKYKEIQQFLDIMVDANVLHMRVQNARSSARDTTEAIRSRIGQLRGQLRSS